MKVQASQVVYKPITVKQLLVTHPHVDGGWFWSKYSAQPYVGCQYGCTYCFVRGTHYGASRPRLITSNIDTYRQEIYYKTNAASILSNELLGVEKEVIVVGDYQPIEAQYKLSRQLLEICAQRHFPVVVIVKSPIIVRDIDVLQEIQRNAAVRVVFSIAFTESRRFQNSFEPYASSPLGRFFAMKKICEAGIPVGASLMPIIPFVNDDPRVFEDIISRTVDHGGTFVMGGGLTLLEGQKQFFYRSVKKYNPEMCTPLRKLYVGKRDPQDNSWAHLGRTIKDLCVKYSLAYRMPRPIPSGPMATQKSIAEKLFLHVYEMELTEQPLEKIQSWRQFAWMVDEFPGQMDSTAISTIALHIDIEKRTLLQQLWQDYSKLDF